MKSEINKQMIDCLIMSADNINVTFSYFFLSGEVSRHYLYFFLSGDVSRNYLYFFLSGDISRHYLYFFCLVTSAETIYIFFVW